MTRLITIFVFISTYLGAQTIDKTYNPFSGINFACSQDSLSIIHNLTLLENFDSKIIEGNKFMYYKLLGGNYFRKYAISHDSIALEKCILSFREIIKISPKDPNTLWNLGSVLIVLKSNCSEGLFYLNQLSKRQKRKFSDSKRSLKDLYKRC